MSVQGRAAMNNVDRKTVRNYSCKVAHIKMAQQSAALLQVMERVLSGEWKVGFLFLANCAVQFKREQLLVGLPDKKQNKRSAFSGSDTNGTRRCRK